MPEMKMNHFMRGLRQMARIVGIGQIRCNNCLRPYFPQDIHKTQATLYLCEECLPLFRAHDQSCCSLCGNIMPMAKEKGIRKCRHCAAEKPAWDSMAFHGFYQDELRELLLKFKFGANLHLAQLFADWLLQASICLTKPDIITAVPMHSSHLCKRGFNQAHELCRATSCKSGFPFTDRLLYRTRKTRAQEELGAEERKTNLANSFAANSMAGKYEHVWLIDDIITTGATLQECCIELKKAGVKRISILVLARTTLV